jgi:hypothetical protein
MRTCSACHEVKSDEEFWRKRKGSDARLSRCIPCQKAAWKASQERRRRGERMQTGRRPRPVPAGTRWCSVCKQPLPLERFAGEERTCRVCKHQRHLARKYGLSMEEYRRMDSEQGGMCACCKARPHRYVDHDHKTGVVRGLLCPRCNTAVGYLETHPMIYEQAAAYLSIARNE